MPSLGRKNNDVRGRQQMATTVNAGARLDRLPISSFHHRIFWLIGAGMFFDGYDLYVGTTVLGHVAKQILDAIAECAVHFAYLPRDDNRGLRHRISRRPFRPTLHLSIQSDDLRARFTRSSVRTEHGDAEYPAV